MELNDISSSRGRNAVSLLPVYLTDARAVTKYDPVSAPDGALQLSVAENQMLEDLLVPALRKFSSSDQQSGSNEVEGLFESDQIYYQPTHGRESLREASHMPPVPRNLQRPSSFGDWTFTAVALRTVGRPGALT